MLSTFYADCCYFLDFSLILFEVLLLLKTFGGELILLLFLKYLILLFSSLLGFEYFWLSDLWLPETTRFIVCSFLSACRLRVCRLD